VDAQLEELFQHPARLAPHLHAPLQSGNDRVLRRMGRHWYTARDYGHAIERIARSLPVFGLGADIIAGFPGETELEHQQTMALVGWLPFTYLHVFPYSSRPGTAAERLPEHLPSDVVQRRARELRTLGEAKARAHRASRVGTIADVIAVRSDTREGMTEDYLAVRIAEPILPRGTRLTARLDGDAETLTAHPFDAGPAE